MHRLWRGRGKLRSFFFYEHRFSRRQKAALAITSVLAGLTALIWVAATQMKPILTSLATSRVPNAVTQVVTNAVNESIDSGEIDYDSLVSFEKDNEGRVTAVRSNMGEFNRLQSSILHQVLEEIAQMDTRELSIPLGSLTGSALLAGRGPRISVRMQSVGSSTAYLSNEFSSAGINQTRHQIILNVDVYVSILLPGFSTATKVSNAFTVAETVLVGTVPDSYTYFQSDTPIEDDARDYVLNGG